MGAGQGSDADGRTPVPDRTQIAPEQRGARREARQFVTHNMVAAGGTWLAGILGLLLQALVSHHFRPAQYGAAFAVFTFFTVVTQPAAGFGRMIAWSTSRELATGDGRSPSSAALLRSTNKRLFAAGAIIGLGFITTAPWLADFLHVPASFVILGALGVPFMLSTSPLLAFLQGQQRWLPWSGLSVAIAAGRVVFVAIFVAWMGIAGVVAGITAGAIAVYAVAVIMVWPALRARSGHLDWHAQRNFLIVSIASTLTVAVLMGCDVLLVEHFFSAKEGGQFSAVTVTSRALFFAMGSITSVLFPKVAARQASSRSTRGVVLASVALGLAGGVAGLIVFSLGSNVILRSFSGRAYVGGASYIGWYALGMPLLASVVMLSNSLQSMADLKLLWVLGPGALLKPVLIIMFHQSLLQVALVSDVSIGMLFVALAATYVLQERRRLARQAQPAAPPAGIESGWVGVTEPAVDVPVPLTTLPPALVPPAPPVTARRAGWTRRSWSMDALHPRAWPSTARTLIDRPRAIVAGLAVLGLLIRHAWISTTPLASGDWHWPDRQRLLEYFPWPSVWDSTLGLGGENRFVGAFRFPVAFVSGALATLGATWTFIEQVLYFIPFAVLLPVSGWLLAREVMGRTRWALLAPLILVGSTYFTLESDGEIPLTLAEVVSMLVLVAFIRTMRRRSLGWAVLTGLLLSVTAAFDIRPAYLVALLMAMYFVVLAIVQHGLPLLGRRVALCGVSAAVFIGCQAFWLVPLLTYHGNAGFPIPQAPDFNVLTLGHGLTGVSAFWTGGQPAVLVQAPLNPVYMILPLVALAALLLRRLRPEVVWLAVAALLFAFFAKTDTAPLGGLYDWMYLHVPGWKLFREGSKFLYIVNLAYAILIPITLSAAFEWARSRPRRAARRAARAGVAITLGSVLALSLSTIAVLESGALRSTTVPTPEPASFSALSQGLAGDSRPGAVLWFGQPVLNDGLVNHHFLIASPTHPAVNLTGSFSSTKINQRDPFQLYCANSLVPFCYANPTLFPYLAHVSGAGYVVVPGGQAAGSLPRGVTRGWLASQMASMFGAPTRLGSGDSALLVWRLPSPAPTVTTAPAVALVDGGTWSTSSVLPALRALGLPAAYAQTYDSLHYPVAPRSLPDAVRILPRTGGSCLGSSGGTMAVMAQSTSPALTITVAGTPTSVDLLTTAARNPGWGLYGPVAMTSGSLAVAAADGTVNLGPCVAWSTLTATALAAVPGSAPSVSTGAGGEQVAATPTAAVGHWVELRRYFDPGWRLDGRKPTALGDGLFNLYHLTAAQASTAKLHFAFSTIPWEHVGQGIAVVVVVVAVLVAVRDLRRRRTVELADLAPLPPMAASPAARWIGAVGMGLLVVTAVATTLEWFGVPSALPGASIASDPYSVDVGYGAVAMGVLLLSLAVRVIGGVVTLGRTSDGERGVPLTTRMGVAATLLMAVTLVAACGEYDPGSFQNLVTEARQAGALAPSVQGASLDDAQLQRSAREPALCIADYTEALKEFPDYVRAYAGRGDCYLNGGQDGPAAVHDYTQALSVSPESVDLYLRRAVAYRVSGNASAAVADYQQAASIPSATGGQLLSAVDGLVALRRTDAAAAVERVAVVLQPQDALLHVAAATIALAKGNDVLANREFATAERLATGGSQTATVLAHVCHADVLRQDYQLAATDCTQAAMLSNGGSGAEDDLSATRLALGDPAGALVAINVSISSFLSGIGPYAQPSGVDGFGLANLYDARGWIDLQLGSKPRALADFRGALAALPQGSGPDTRARIKANLTTARAD